MPPAAVLSFDVGTRNLAVALVRVADLEPIEWEVIDVKRGRTAVPMEEICDNIVELLDGRAYMGDPSVPVFIERQEVSNHAMVSVSLMLMTYFRTRYPSRVVDFVSASNKFSVGVLTDEERAAVRGKDKYSARKAIAKKITCQLLPRGQDAYPAWHTYQSKRDDLCDAYNQAVFVIKNGVEARL